MKYETYQYDRIFEILKHKIESGRMPKGTVLPSIADLCREYKVSNKTIRRVVAEFWRLHHFCLTLRVQSE